MKGMKNVAVWVFVSFYLNFILSIFYRISGKVWLDFEVGWLMCVHTFIDAKFYIFSVFEDGKV